jgi:subtilisin family serine protease
VPPPTRPAATAAQPAPVASVTPSGHGWSEGQRRIAARQLLLIDQPPAALSLARRLGFAVLEQHRLPSLGIAVARLQLPAGMTPSVGRDLLLRRRPSAIVEYDDLYVPEGSLSLPPPDYARRLIAWGMPQPDCGAGLRIGIVDTAIDADLPALAQARLRQQAFGAADAADAGHGTAIAAILAGQGGGGGLLPGATLLAAQVFGRDAAGQPVADAVAVAAALDWLVKQGAAVANLSLAGHDNRLIRVAVQRAAARGLILVAAAGNDGPAAPPAYPAGYPEVIAVAAVDSRGRPDPAGNRGAYIAFAAPGLQVWSPTRDGGQLNSGSSFATPFVAAAVAAELMQGGRRDRRALEARLAAAALDLGTPGRDPVFGWGLVRARPSCAAAVTAQSP